MTPTLAKRGFTRHTDQIRNQVRKGLPHTRRSHYEQYTYIGMDIHSTNYTLCAYTVEGQKFFGQTSINPNIKELVKYLDILNVQ